MTEMHRRDRHSKEISKQWVVQLTVKKQNVPQRYSCQNQANRKIKYLIQNNKIFLAILAKAENKSTTRGSSKVAPMGNLPL